MRRGCLPIIQPSVVDSKVCLLSALYLLACQLDLLGAGAYIRIAQGFFGANKAPHIPKEGVKAMNENTFLFFLETTRW